MYISEYVFSVVKKIYTLKSGDHGVETGIVVVKQEKSNPEANYISYQNKII